MIGSRELVALPTTAQLRDVSRLIWPDLTLVEGCVVRRERVTPTVRNMLATADPEDLAGLVVSINALNLAAITSDGQDADAAIEIELGEIAELMAACWRARVAEMFPDRRVDVLSADGSFAPVLSLYSGPFDGDEPVPSDEPLIGLLAAPPTTTQLAAIARLFWPQLVEVDGCVLLAERYDRSGMASLRDLRAGNDRAVEATLNETRVWDEAADDGGLPDDLEEVTRRLAACRRHRLATAFPGEQFVIDVVDRPLVSGPTVTFYRAPAAAP